MGDDKLDHNFVTRRKKVAETYLEELSQKRATKKDDPTLIDRENAFLLYASFSGDARKTAHALNADPVIVLRVADEEHWQTRIASLLELKKSGRPGDVERGINRTMNFVQAHRMRLVLERLIHKLSMMSDEDLLSYCLEDIVEKDGSVRKKISTRPFADLTSAMEKIQMLTYAALNDTTVERSVRAKKDEADESITVTDMHAAIAKQMAEAGASQSPRAQLFDAQLKQAQLTALTAEAEATRAAQAQAEAEASSKPPEPGQLNLQ
jgi:hypothetical protein